MMNFPNGLECLDRSAARDPENLELQLRSLSERLRSGTLSMSRLRAAARIGHQSSQFLSREERPGGLIESYSVLSDPEKRAFLGDCFERVSFRYENYSFNTTLGIRSWETLNEQLTEIQSMAWNEWWIHAWYSGGPAVPIAENAGRISHELEPFLGQGLSLAVDKNADKFLEIARWALYYLDENEYQWQRARLSEYLIHGLGEGGRCKRDLSASIVIPWRFEEIRVDDPF